MNNLDCGYHPEYQNFTVGNELIKHRIFLIAEAKGLQKYHFHLRRCLCIASHKRDEGVGVRGVRFGVSHTKN